MQAYFKKYALQIQQKVVAIGKTTQKALNKLGITDVLVAEKPSETALVEAVLRLNIMLSRYAVIDLGTNTFHLLVVEKQAAKSFKELHRQRFFVKLAEEGIETLGTAPMQRGFSGTKNFQKSHR